MPLPDRVHNCHQDSNRWLKNGLQTDNSSNCSSNIAKPSGATLRRELENAHIIYTGDTSTLVNVFMPRDDALDTEDDEMDVTDHELEEFKRFCFMRKPLENHQKVTVRVNLSELTLKKT